MHNGRGGGNVQRAVAGAVNDGELGANNADPSPVTHVATPVTIANWEPNFNLFHFFHHLRQAPTFNALLDVDVSVNLSSIPVRQRIGADRITLDRSLVLLRDSCHPAITMAPGFLNLHSALYTLDF